MSGSSSSSTAPDMDKFNKYIEANAQLQTLLTEEKSRIATLLKEKEQTKLKVDDNIDSSSILGLLYPTHKKE